MSESNGEKRFEATPARIAKAKREGNVVRAQEFGANVAFLCAAGAAIGVTPSIGELGERALRDAASGSAPVAEAAVMCALALVPLGAAAASGAVASLLQSGGIYVTPVTVKFSRMNPAEG